MPGQARTGDLGQGICYAHPVPQPYITVLNTGASTIFGDNSSNAVVGSIGICTCGHPTIAQTGSPNVFFENQAAHRQGDTGANYGPYVVTLCSSDVIDN